MGASPNRCVPGAGVCYGLAAIAAAIIVLAAIAPPIRAQAREQHSDEYRVKAAFLFHFAQLVDWPADPPDDSKNPFVVCTLGSDPFRGDLENTIGGKSIGARVVQIRHLKAPQDASSCQILFIPRDEDSQLTSILAALAGDAVLTLGEADDFIQRGGMIRLFVEDSRVRFDVNQGAANRAGLRVGARLLVLASNAVTKK
jgi:YfiR/HmsC-like